MQVYPIRFRPVLKQKIWGGNDLNDLKNLNVPITRLGESWEISAVKGDLSIVENGDYSDLSIDDLIHLFPEQLLGKKVIQQFGAQFPLLIKFINAAQNLSIQVHPDDTVAQLKHDCFGKTEMWYVMDAVPDAQLVLGFKEDCGDSAFAKAISENTVMELLNSENVVAGDAFFIHPGLVHAIGAGVTLAEIQQSSDVTYRVYDYDRKDDEGNSRELHIDDAIQVTDYKKSTDHKIDYNPNKTGSQNLKTTNYFTTDYLRFKGCRNIEVATHDSFMVLMNVGASCSIYCDGVKYDFNYGQTVLLPAAIPYVRVQSAGDSKLLAIHL